MSLVAVVHLRRMDKEDRKVEHRHETTLKRLRGHLARADGELKAAQHFLDLGTRDEDEAALVRAIAEAKASVGVALETAQCRLEGSDRG